MKIRYRLNPSDPCFSFEFFPPKTDQGFNDLFQTIEDLAPLEPGFVSVTYGAGGSTRDRTVELVTKIKSETRLEPMAHLSCVGHTKDDLQSMLDRVAKAGIQNVLALRGDPPKGEKVFTPTPGGFRYAIPTIEGVTVDERGDFWCVVDPRRDHYRPVGAAPESLYVYLAAEMPMMYKFPGRDVWRTAGLTDLWTAH